MNGDAYNEISDEELAYESDLAWARTNEDTERENVEYLRERKKSGLAEAGMAMAKKKLKQQAKKMLARAVMQVLQSILLFFASPPGWIVLLIAFGGLAIAVGIVFFKDCIGSAGCWKDIGITIGETLGDAAWDNTLGKVGIPKPW